MVDTFLDIVDENDQIIGRELRSVVHKTGLLHREIHVWFVTPDRKVIFQKRGPNKDTWPNFYDATVGGHVELGATYEQTAVIEVLEETGLDISGDSLHVITKKRSGKKIDPKTGANNQAFRKIFGFLFTGNIADLVAEEGSGEGFKAYALESVLNPTQEMLDEIIPSLIAPEHHPIFHALEKLVP